MVTNNGTKMKTLDHNGIKVKKWIHNNVQVFLSAQKVTYIIDSSTTYTEEREEGSNLLSPTSFNVPAKSGYKFVGWSTTSGGTVLTSMVMGNSPVALYAVYIPNTITITISNSGIYPYVATGGNYVQNDGWWNGNHDGYLSTGLFIEDLGNGYLNRLIDFTHYRTLTVNTQGVWFNHKGTLTFGVGNNTTAGSFVKSTNMNYLDANNSASGSLDISDVNGNAYIKLSNNATKACGITSIVISV